MRNIQLRQKKAFRRKWKCKEPRCQNRPYYCWVDEGDMHWPLETGDVNLWYGAISRDTSGRMTDKRPPLSITERWTREKSKEE